MGGASSRGPILVSVNLVERAARSKKQKQHVAMRPRAGDRPSDRPLLHSPFSPPLSPSSASSCCRSSCPSRARGARRRPGPRGPLRFWQNSKKSIMDGQWSNQRCQGRDACLCQPCSQLTTRMDGGRARAQHSPSSFAPRSSHEELRVASASTSGVLEGVGGRDTRFASKAQVLSPAQRLEGVHGRGAPQNSNVGWHSPATRDLLRIEKGTPRKTVSARCALRGDVRLVRLRSGDADRSRLPLPREGPGNAGRRGRA